MSTPPERVMKSEYMHWAKTHIGAEFNIGASGVTNYPLSGLPVRLSDLEITGESYYGYAPLQEAIARYAGVPTSMVLSALGTSQANHIAMAAVLRPGDGLLLEDPSYELIESTARYLGAAVSRFPRLPEKDFAVDADDVCRRIGPRTRVVALTNLHNPTSGYIDDRTLTAIGRECERRGAYLLVDEVYLDSAFGRDTRTSARLGKNFIVTSSLTKVYGLSGLRCGWVLAAPELVESMWRLKDLFESIPPHVPERLGVIAFANLERIRERSRGLIDENRTTLRSTLLPRPDIECFDPGFGTVVFPRYTGGDVDNLAAELLEHRATLITPGRFFGMPDRFRIGLGGKPEIFREGMNRLCLELDAVRRG
jgi:aspartate/methionine/tyrosine aminotransferase